MASWEARPVRNLGTGNSRDYFSAKRSSPTIFCYRASEISLVSWPVAALPRQAPCLHGFCPRVWMGRGAGFAPGAPWNSRREFRLCRWSSAQGGAWLSRRLERDKILLPERDKILLPERNGTRCLSCASGKRRSSDADASLADSHPRNWDVTRAAQGGRSRVMVCVCELLDVH